MLVSLLTMNASGTFSYAHAPSRYVISSSSYCTWSTKGHWLPSVSVMRTAKDCVLQSLFTTIVSRPLGAMPGDLLLGQLCCGPPLIWNRKPPSAGFCQDHPSVCDVLLVMVCVALHVCVS